MPKLCLQSLGFPQHTFSLVLRSPRYQDKPHRGTAAVRENPGAKDTASRGRGCHKAKGLASYIRLGQPRLQLLWGRGSEDSPELAYLPLSTD